MIPFYENTFDRIYASDCETLTFPAHLHNAIECIYVIRGEIEILIENTSYLLKEGEMAVVFPNMVHSYFSNQNQENLFELFIYPIKATSKIYGIVLDKKPAHPILLRQQIRPDIPNQFHEVVELYHLPQPNQLLMETLVQLILIRICDQLELIESPSNSNENIIGKAVIYITENFKSDLSLVKIAKHLGVSKYYLSRILKNALEIGVCSYINRLRIDYAKGLLTSTDLSISEIAMESGYDSLRTFNRCFKEILACSPKEFRKSDHTVTIKNK
ncbi:MAG: AraC family transcriptional regulator [Oscillospiraceae bacterium]